MKRKILSAMLSLAICVGLMIPAMGAQNEDQIVKTIPLDTISDFGLDSMKSNGAFDYYIRNMVAQADSEFAQAEANRSSLIVSPANTAVESASSIAQRAPVDRNVRIPSVSSVQNLRSTALVSNASELSVALTNTSISIVLVTANITLTDALLINHTVIMMTTGSSFTITSASGKPHFLIQNQTTSMSVTFANLVLDGNGLGGGIRIEDSIVSINGATIQNCADNGSCSGAAIVASNISRDSSTNEYHISGSLTINGGLFTDNAADAGAIESFGPISIYGATISDNTGSGVFALNISEEGATAYFESVTVEDNTADSMGGGLNLIGYTVVITGQTTNESTIAGNTAQYGGGGICAYMCSTNISYTTIANNTIEYTETNDDNFEPIDIGGAGIMSVGNFTMSNSEVVDNTGDCDFGFGVGIYAVSAEEMLDNEPEEGDDYPWLNGSFTISNSTISGNDCVWSTGTPSYARYMNGGGIAVIGLKPTVSNTIVSYNNALIGGGAVIIYAYNENDLEPLEDPISHWTGVTVSGNTGKMAGGGIAMIGPGGVGDEMVVPATVKSKLSVENQSAVSSNHSCFGGGVAVFSVELTVTGETTIQSNEADSSLYTPVTGDNVPSWNCAGAGILLYRQSKFNLLNGQVLSNSVSITTGQQSAGAGVYAHGTSEVLINGAGVKVNGNGNATYGGGIYSESQAIQSVVNGEIKQNSAKYGAGTYCCGILSITGGTFNTNTATEDGGGVYLHTTGNLALSSNGSITGNQAKNGGGIYSAGPMTLSGGTITYNNASLNGGGIYATKAVTMAQTGISNNTAVLNGGGVYYNSALSTWTMNSGSISENKAHVSGGGFYGIGPRMKFVMNGGTISFNLAGYEEDDPEFDTDSNVHYGGGVYLGEGIGGCSITGGSITYNTATYGGGVYTVRNMSLTGGSITGNYAMSMNGLQPLGKGGGLYIADTAIVENIGQPCQIINNIADLADPVYGYNVWVEPGAQYIII